MGVDIQVSRDGKFVKKLIDLLSKSIIIDAITNEFASCQALRNDKVDRIS